VAFEVPQGLFVGSSKGETTPQSVGTQELDRMEFLVHPSKEWDERIRLATQKVVDQMMRIDKSTGDWMPPAYLHQTEIKFPMWHGGGYLRSDFWQVESNADLEWTPSRRIEK